MKKLFVFCMAAVLLLAGCVANEKNDPFYGELPTSDVTATPEVTETPTITATPEITEAPVNTEEPITTPTIEVIATPDTSKGTKKYVNVDKINVRKSNSALAEKVGLLSKGDEVIAYSAEGEWIYICFDLNKYGYVNKKYLSDTKPSMEKPTAKPTATPTKAPTVIEPTLQPTEKPTSPPFLSPSVTPESDESFDLPDDML